MHDETIQVRAVLPEEPELSEIAESEAKLGLHWYPGHVAARRLGISSHFLSRITGTVYALEGSAATAEAKDDADGGGPAKHNLGLNLKSSRKGEEVADYTKKEEQEGGKSLWLYSSKVLALLQEYGNKFPGVFAYIQNVSTQDDVYYADDLFGPGKGAEKLKEVRDWLKGLDSYKAARQATGTGTIDERVIGVIQEQIRRLTQSPAPPKKVKLQVKVGVLYRPCLDQGNAVPDPMAFYELFDRVVNVKEGSSIPLGLRGTVVGVHPGRTEVETRLDVIFDQEFPGGTIIRSSGPCGARLPLASLVNLSHGRRLVLRLAGFGRGIRVGDDSSTSGE